MTYRLISKLFLVAVLFVTISCRKSIPEPQTQSFASGLTIINDEFNGTEIVVVGNEGLQLLVAFGRRLDDGTVLEMGKSTNQSIPVVCMDQEGNNWDLFGECVSGPREGEHLPFLHSSLGFYFAFNSVFNGVEIYGAGDVNPEDHTFENEDWLIDEEFVFAAGGFDAIPSVDDPKFEVYRSRDFLESSFHVRPDDRITVVKVGDEIRAYPHNILSRHEVINDVINETPIAINFCPLTATGYCWERGGNTYGVSGMLYNNNLIMYDRNRESLWSQMLGMSVFGEGIGETPNTIATFETTFESFKNMYDLQVDVMTTETGVTFLYEGNPYVEYISIDNFLLFPVIYKDERLLNKDRVMGVEINGECKVYPFSLFN